MELDTCQSAVDAHRARNDAICLNSATEHPKSAICDVAGGEAQSVGVGAHGSDVAPIHSDIRVDKVN